MSTSRCPLARRLTAGVALLALPMGAAGCSSAADSRRDSVQTALQNAAEHLQDSESLSVVLRFDDPAGTAKKAVTAGSRPMSPAQADLLLGGTVSITVDPAAGTKLRDLQTASPGLPPGEQLKLANVAMSVQADGGPVAQLRLVAGDLYVTVSLDKISDIAGKGGSTTDLDARVDELAAQSPGELAPLLRDVKAGKWIKLPLAPYVDRLKGRQPPPSAPVDSRKLGMDLLAAVQPFVAVTDTTSSGSERVLDVKVQAKQALRAALQTVKSTGPALPGLDRLDTSGIDRLGNGTVDGQLTLDDDHLRKITLDLTSAVKLAPPGATPAPDLTGSTVTVDVDDAAEEVTVPEQVSSVDVNALVQQLIGSLGGTRRS